MNRSLSNLLTMILAFVGCGVALMLTFGEHAADAAGGCFKNGAGCASTTGSVYGHFGPLPTSLLGLLMYLTFIGLCLARGKQLRLARERETTRAAAYASSASSSTSSFDTPGMEGESPRGHAAPAEPSEIGSGAGASGGNPVRKLDMAIWGLALLGFGISIWLQRVAIYQLHSFCKYCFASAALVTLIFALASRDYLLDGRKLTGEQKMIGGVLALIVVLGSFMIIPDIMLVLHTPPTPVPQSVPDARGPLTASMLHTKGDANAKYTLIEFADYQCSHCSDAAKEVEAVYKQHPKEIRLVFRNFPLGNHRWAKEAAGAAEAAGEQGKFWEMHDLLFQHTKDMEGPNFDAIEFDGYAQSLHLDMAKFKKDRVSSAMENRIRADMAAGEAGHVEFTPTFFFISPHHVTSLPGLTELEKFIAKPKNEDWD